MKAKKTYADKFIIMKEYNDNIDKIIEAYTKLKKLNILLINTILEDSSFKSAIIFKRAFNNGLRVYYDNETKEMKVDSSTTSKIKIDEIELINKILKNMSEELKEKLIDYQKMIDSIEWKEYEEWSEF